MSRSAVLNKMLKMNVAVQMHESAGYYFVQPSINAANVQFYDPDRPQLGHFKVSGQHNIKY